MVLISWITQLCAICTISAMAQMILPKEDGREGIRLLCGMMMMKLTCESAAALIKKMAACADLTQMFSCLIH